MPELITQANADAYIQFEKWLSEQPYWLQDAAWHIYHGQAIDNSKIADYAEMCVAQAKKEKVDYKHIEENGSRKSSVDSKMSVLKLSKIVGVNALAMDATIDFSETGVTVIYGLNGAGKSGFMRIFKQLSSNPYEEPIQPNVFKKASAIKPSCTFSIIENGEQKEIPCDLSCKSKDNPLSNCDVFDTRISNAYITNTNTVSYQPFVFTVLSELSKVADRISAHIKTLISSITPTTVNIPDDFSDREDAVWIRNLGFKSSIPKSYTEWSYEQQKLYEEFPRLLDTEKVKEELKLLKIQYLSLESIFKDLNDARESQQKEFLIQAYEAYRSDKNKVQAAEKLFTDRADEQDKISVSATEWKSLWRIAKSYYESFICENNNKQFGEDGSVCPLCHQEISGKALVRFQSVNEYVNGTCSENYNKSKATLKKILMDIVTRTYSSSQIMPQISSIFDENDSKTIESAFLSIEFVKQIEDLESAYSSLKKVNLNDAVKLIEEKIKTIEDRIVLLNGSLEDEGRAERQKEFDDLKYHKWIFEHKTSIETVIANIKRIQELKNTKPYLTTNKITLESNTLADTLLTDAYIDRFTRELKHLAPKIQVKLEKAASKKGNSPYKVTIKTETGHHFKPEDILSEGEQRIVALSAFFADATGRNELTPLIIDDPISSLDYNFEDSATKRIVELAKNRQVIVFTHRISLLVGLKEGCEENGVPCVENRIRSAIKGKGVPDFEGNYYGKIPGQLKELIGRVAQIKKKDPDSEEYIDAIGRTCQQFRICVERAVEDELLFGVVKRFSRKIRTDGLVKKLPVISEEDCEMIDKMMTKYSFMEHSQPAEAPVEYYELDEIKSDIELFNNWLTGFRTKAKKFIERR